MNQRTLLQIVPRVPGGFDGVGDYALTLSTKLRDQFGCRTVFAAFDPGEVEKVAGFEVRSLESVIEEKTADFENVLLHYVNYGFQKRGVPIGLMSILRSLRKRYRGHFVTVFHELYASGPPWGSAFWLQPLQIHFAKVAGRFADTCVVSSESSLRELKWLVPGARIELHPVPSSFGEPVISPEQIAGRDPHQWAILGGNALLERSLRSLRHLCAQIPKTIAPRRLFIVGGKESASVRSLIAELGVESTYRPSVAADEGSELLRNCSYLWFDYFHRPEVETSIALKSSAFASASAHGVIPVFPHPGSSISIGADRLPGPFFVSPHESNVPDRDQRPKVAVEIYDWYQRYASSQHLVKGIAQAFELPMQ